MSHLIVDVQPRAGDGASTFVLPPDTSPSIVDSPEMLLAYLRERMRVTCNIRVYDRERGRKILDIEGTL